MPLVDWEVVARPFGRRSTVRAEVDDRRSRAGAGRAALGRRREPRRSSEARARGAAAGARRGAPRAAGCRARRHRRRTAGRLRARGRAGRRRLVVVQPAGRRGGDAPALVVPVGWSLAHVDYRAFQHPTFHAHGSELPRLLAFSAQLTDASKGYTASYETALLGLVNLVSVVSDPTTPPTAVHEFVVGSDIHSNALPLRAFGRYAKGKPIFLVGDFSQLGTGVRGVDRGRRGADSARPSSRSAATTTRAADAAPRRARRDGAAQRRRARPAGPARAGAGDHGRRHDGGRLVRPARGVDARRSACTRWSCRATTSRRPATGSWQWFDGLRPRPQIVLVHQHGLAHALLDHVAAQTGPARRW